MIQNNFEKHSLTNKLLESWFGPALIYLSVIYSFFCTLMLVGIGNEIGAVISFVIFLISLRLNHLSKKKYNIQSFP